MLGLVENAYLQDLGWEVYWWIALNDVAVEGEFKWPVGGAANYTNWDDYHGEPFPDENHEANCVEMQSAEYFSLLWMTYYCEDTDNIFPKIFELLFSFQHQGISLPSFFSKGGINKGRT